MNTTISILHVMLAMVVANVAGAGKAGAQDASRSLQQIYPAGPVRVVVPYPAGGPTDVIARIAAERLSLALGQQFYVENHPGAGGSIGAGLVAQAPPDGHTLLLCTNDLAARPALASTVPYDPIRSFAPVSLLAVAPEVVVVHPSLPATSMQQLVAHLRANPGTGNIATPGTGTTTHLGAVRLFQHMLHLDVALVPFGGGAPAILATLGQHTAIAYTALPAAAPYLQDGSLRGLAVASAGRVAEFPDVPTLGEAGVPDHVSEVIIGVMAPAGTPGPVVTQLHQQLARITIAPDVVERLRGLGFTVVARPPLEFARRTAAEVELWARVARDANIVPEK